LKSVGSLRATEVTFFKSVPLAHSCIYNTTLKVVDLTILLEIKGSSRILPGSADCHARGAYCHH
ncbi:MAG: hypothetical protein L3J50_13845, partial [Emcibacter sp.]|nr:hypothetical protein [Emcibacter sp.]